MMIGVAAGGPVLVDILFVRQQPIGDYGYAQWSSPVVDNRQQVG